VLGAGCSRSIAWATSHEYPVAAPGTVGWRATGAGCWVPGARGVSPERQATSTW